MTERTEEQTARMRERLIGKKIENVEISGTGEIGGTYIKLWIEGDLDLFASNPALYVPVETLEAELSYWDSAVATESERRQLGRQR